MLFDAITQIDIAPYGAGVWNTAEVFFKGTGTQPSLKYSDAATKALVTDDYMTTHEVAYCMEMNAKNPIFGKNFTETSLKDFTDASGNKIPETSLEALRSVLLNGYPARKGYWGSETDGVSYFKQAVATQIAVWQITGEKGFSALSAYNSVDTYEAMGTDAQIVSMARQLIAWAKMSTPYIPTSNISITVEGTSCEKSGSNYVYTWTIKPTNCADGTKITFSEVPNGAVVKNGSTQVTLSGNSFTVDTANTDYTVTMTIPTKDNSGKTIKLTASPYAATMELDDIEYYKTTDTYNSTKVQDMIFGVLVSNPTGISSSASLSSPNGFACVKKESANKDMTDGNACYSLAGAEYTFYKNFNGVLLSGEVGKVTIKANGDSDVIQLDPGTYYCKETKAPTDGHFKLSNKVYEITVEDGDDEDNPAVLNVTDPPKYDPLGITITKVPTGQNTDTIPSLEGTQFTIEYYDNMNRNTSGTPKRKWVIEVKYSERYKAYLAGLSEDYLVDELSDDLYKGNPGITALPLGTYKVWESKAAPNYQIKGTIKNKDGTFEQSIEDPYITVLTGTGDDVSLTGGNEYTISNEPCPLSVKVRKLGEDNQPLAGVSFTLKSESGYMENQPGFKATLTTGADGVIEWNDLYPDKYTLTEVKTEDGKNLLINPIEISGPMTLSKDEADRYHVVDPDLNSADDGIEWDAEKEVFYIRKFVFEVTNSLSFDMPMTGGVSDAKTFLPLLFGFTLIASVGLYGWRRKRRSI